MRGAKVDNATPPQIKNPYEIPVLFKQILPSNDIFSKTDEEGSPCSCLSNNLPINIMG